MGAATVAILMGSDSDWPIMKKATLTLNDFGVPHEAHVMSAHRTPDDVADYVRQAPGRRRHARGASTRTRCQRICNIIGAGDR